MFDLPPHVRLSEWVTALVLVAASAGAAVRTWGAYPRETYGGIVAFLLLANAVVVWSLFRNDSLRRQRMLGPDSLSKYQDEAES